MNLGNPDEFTVLELAALVRDLTGTGVDIRFDPLPVDDPTRRRPDVALAERVLGWRPEVDLRTGLTRLVDWYRTERAPVG
jgi:nucleoside-diphosphate-sugar epimerase